MSERVNSTYLELITGPGGWVVIKAIYLLRRLEQVSELFEVGDEEIRCVKPSYTVVKLVSEFARPLYKLTQPFFESFQYHCLVHSASATRKDIDFMNKIQSTCFLQLGVAVLCQVMFAPSLIFHTTARGLCFLRQKIVGSSHTPTICCPYVFETFSVQRWFHQKTIRVYQNREV